MADAAMAGRAARAEEDGYMKTYLNLHMFRYQNEGCRYDPKPLAEICGQQGLDQRSVR